MTLSRSILLTFSLLALLATAPLYAQNTPPTSKTPPNAAPTAAQYWTGVAFKAIPSDFGRVLALAPGQGLQVMSVFPGSPAEAANLKQYDLLILLNDRPLSNQHQFFEATADSIKKHPPTPLRLVCIRGGERLTINVTPALRPESMQIHNPTAMQVGTGVLLDPTIPTTNIPPGILKTVALEGKTIVISQDADQTGRLHTKVRITDAAGAVTEFDVDPAHLADLPPDVRDLVTPLLPAAKPPEDQSLRQQVADQAKQIEDLKRQNEEMLQQNKELNTKLNQLLERTSPTSPK